MLQRYILLWLLLSSGVALFWPHFGITGNDPFLWMGNSSIKWLIMIAMFGVGALLAPGEVDELAKSWRVVLAGTAIQYTCMPFLAWLAVQLTNPDPELATGIIIVGCVPGAIASNVLTLTARGNVSYSVCLTTAATLLSPVVVPLALRLALGKDVEYDGTQAVSLLVTQIVLPVIAGHLLSRYWGGFRRIAGKVAPIAANLAILGVIAIAVALKRDEVRSASMVVVLPLLGINLLGYLSGYAGGRLLGYNEPMRRALTLEVGMQNAGAGTTIAIQLFGNDSAAIIPCVVYTFGCMLTGTILASVWNHFPPRQDEKSRT